MYVYLCECFAFSAYIHNFHYIDMKFVYKFNGQIDLGQMFIILAKDA